MKGKSKSGTDTEKQYQFESAFPMDETLQRLHEEMEPIQSELFFLKKYKIWSDKRRGSIQFEIVKRPTRARHKLTVSGTIHEIDQNRSALECQVKGNNPIRHTALWALPLFLAFMLVWTNRGALQWQDALLPSLATTVIVLYVFAPSVIRSWAPMTWRTLGMLSVIAKARTRRPERSSGNPPPVRWAKPMALATISGSRARLSLPPRQSPWMSACCRHHAW